MSHGDADDHFWFPICEQSVFEVCHGRIEPADDIGDEEEDGSDAGSAAIDGALAGSLSTVIGERSEADELSDGLVRESSDLRKFGEQCCNGTVCHAFD